MDNFIIFGKEIALGETLQSVRNKFDGIEIEEHEKQNSIFLNNMFFYTTFVDAGFYFDNNNRLKKILLFPVQFRDLRGF